MLRNFSEPQEVIDRIQRFESRGKDFKFSVSEIEEIFLIGEKVKLFAKDFELIQKLLSDPKKILLNQIDEKMQNFVGWFFEGHEDQPSNALKDKLDRLMPLSVGTGFLVGDSYLLTNYHLLPFKDEDDNQRFNDDLSKQFIAQFGYESDLLGRESVPVEYELDQGFHVFNQSLDYTLVKLKEKPTDQNLSLGKAGDYFGWITMSEVDQSIAPALRPEEIEILRASTSNLEIPVGRGLMGDVVSIIQHPKGRRKQIVLSNNRVRRIFKHTVWYTADADFGSSGSPVFNSQWQLVALHNAAVSAVRVDATTESGEPLGFELYKDQSGKTRRKFKVQAEQGIRISSILQDLRDKANDAENKDASEIRDFLTRFVDTVERPSDVLNSDVPEVKEVPTPYGGLKQQDTSSK